MGRRRRAVSLVLGSLILFRSCSCTMISRAAAASFDLLLCLPEGMKRTQVKAHLNRCNDRRTSSSEDCVEAEWKSKIEKNSFLYNGSKFRFAGFTLSGDERNQESHVLLQFGITDYRAHVGTNLRADWGSMLSEDLNQHAGENVFEYETPSGETLQVHEKDANSGECMANTLGNAAIVETCDGQIVLLQRSGNVGECHNAVVLPGGHAEPERIGIKSLQDWNEMNEKGTVPTEDDVVSELWNAILEEVEEETGILPSEVEEPIFLGFARRVVNHRTCMLFLVKTRLSSSEVIERYSSAQLKDRFESLKIFTVSIQDLIRQVLYEDNHSLPGCHVGCLELYRHYLLKSGTKLI
mmetsp:Transcript_21287/g.70587  ORF Transcript_21287/g.70587 Transcript_21287/m.70587 type:complete len:352 (-) Transcript_21287:36-1091(-)